MQVDLQNLSRCNMLLTGSRAPRGGARQVLRGACPAGPTGVSPSTPLIRAADRPLVVIAMAAQTARLASSATPREGECFRRWYSLAHDATAPAAARHLTRDVLGRWGLSEESCDTAVLLVSELVTNAVQHALPPVSLSLQQRIAGGEREVRIHVGDGGPASDGRHLADSDEHGRGLFLLAALASASGAERDPAGGWRRWLVIQQDVPSTA
ncbi:ATP-binding protein [Streptomyces flaveolus]|uniref:ATP-binding protein n=1 Tax=Streptomyces flaveolus TaxID=67297 RepID=UPI00341B7F2B